jgi:hypothetical protein
MFLQIGGERLQPSRLMTELALDLDAAGTPVVRRKEGTIE